MSGLLPPPPCPGDQPPLVHKGKQDSVRDRGKELSVDSLHAGVPAGGSPGDSGETGTPRVCISTNSQGAQQGSSFLITGSGP